MITLITILIVTNLLLLKVNRHLVHINTSLNGTIAHQDAQLRHPSRRAVTRHE